MITRKNLIRIGAVAGIILVIGIAGYIFIKSFSTESITSLLPHPLPETDAPLYISTMTHMESGFTDDKNKNIFSEHVADMEWAMDLFDEYGAKLTFESEEPFAKANTIWNKNILKEVIRRGHGVGTHADFGGPQGKPLTVTELTNLFRANKTLVDNLVGAENNLGVSGGTGATDWVLAASGAGFKYMDASTGIAYLSMAQSERPQKWTNTYIQKTSFHYPIPPDFSERIYPIMLKDATDLVADDDGIIAAMFGELGELGSLAEDRDSCTPNCTFDMNDVEEVKAAIIEADSIRDREKFARINMHIPLVLLDKENEAELREMLSMIKTYVDNGTVVWGTQIETYKAFIEWNQK
ncbi:MAG: hypothetical protein WCT28_04635 [Patescibacteria group bacterium]|jgi:hypothetical protein